MERQPRRAPRRSTATSVVSAAPRTVFTFVIATALFLATFVSLPASWSAASTAHASTSGTLQPTALPSTGYGWYALNDSNQLAGITYGAANAGADAARWSSGKATTFPFSESEGEAGAEAIDDAGDIFGGVASGSAHEGFPAIWSPTGTLTKLTAAAGYEDSINVSIHSASTNGNALGFTNKSASSNVQYAFTAEPPGYSVKFLPADIGIAAEAINNSGAIAAESFTAPYVWENGAKRALKVSPTSHFDFNNNGDVAGYSVPLPASGNGLPAIELANGTVENLPTLSPGDEVSVNAINDHDEVVGVDENHSTGVSTAVAWINGKEIPVASLVAGSSSTSFTNAIDVNNNGSILAESGSTYYLLAAPSGYLLKGEIILQCDSGGAACLANGEPFEGLTVNVTGDNGSASDTTNDDGMWSVNLPKGTYTITPTDPDVKFLPLNAEVNLDSDTTAGKFSACASGQTSSPHSFERRAADKSSSLVYSLVALNCTTSEFSIAYHSTPKPRGRLTVIWHSAVQQCETASQKKYVDKQETNVPLPFRETHEQKDASGVVVSLLINSPKPVPSFSPIVNVTVNPGYTSGTVKLNGSGVVIDSDHDGEISVCHPVSGSAGLTPGAKLSPVN